jgi:putative membrane protein
MIKQTTNRTVKEIKNNLFYKLLANPNVYLKVLLLRTLVIGLFTAFMTLGINFMGWETYTIPASMHSLIGLVIGLLLVFRTNTAYDRWWEGRKTISGVSHEVDMISARLHAMSNNDYSNTVNLLEFKKNVIKFLMLLRDYLNAGEDGGTSTQFHLNQKKHIERAMLSINGMDQSNIHISGLLGSLNKLVEYSNGLERIKNTPIPLSYVFHIKISIYIYLFSLPFGIFHDLEIFAVPLVMLIYYIIAGVEIISNEIENPFANDPNDLPTVKLFNVMLKTLGEDGKI